MLTLVPDINVMLRDVQLRKANGTQLRRELVVPSFVLFYVQYAPHALEGGVSRREATPLDLWIDCMWLMWMADLAQGSKCKRISVYCV